MKLLKRLFCNHNFVFIRNIHGDEIIERGWKRSVWRCAKCKKVVDRNEYHHTDKP
jgi:Zn-finger protein